MRSECIVFTAESLQKASDIYRELDLTEQDIIDSFLSVFGVSFKWSIFFERYNIYNIEEDAE
jgi:hypothetical protein